MEPPENEDEDEEVYKDGAEKYRICPLSRDE
jgi:hypothetical protein